MPRWYPHTYALKLIELLASETLISRSWSLLLVVELGFHHHYLATSKRCCKLFDINAMGFSRLLHSLLFISFMVNFLFFVCPTILTKQV